MLCISHLDYSNASSYGLPNKTIKKYQIIQNIFAKLVLAAQTTKNYLQNRTTHIKMQQQSSSKIPAGTYHIQKANVRKYAL